MDITEVQKNICQKYNSEFLPISENESIIMIGDDFSGVIMGSRIIDWNTEGKEVARWYLTFGDVQNDDIQEEYITLTELKERFPKILPFLGLELDFNFIIDEEGNEDVWFED